MTSTEQTPQEAKMRRRRYLHIMVALISLPALAIVLVYVLRERAKPSAVEGVRNVRWGMTIEEVLGKERMNRPRHGTDSVSVEGVTYLGLTVTVHYNFVDGNLTRASFDLPRLTQPDIARIESHLASQYGPPDGRTDECLAWELSDLSVMFDKSSGMIYFRHLPAHD